MIDHEYGGSCSKLKEMFDIDEECCATCHEEDNLGYGGLIEFYDDHNEVYYRACCSAADKVSERNNNSQFI